jgi:hypothetical protein
MKSFRAKDGSDQPPSGGRNSERDFHGETRGDDTHASITDPQARLYRKGKGKEAKLSYIGNALTENRHGLVVDAAHCTEHVQPDLGDRRPHDAPSGLCDQPAAQAHRGTVRLGQEYWRSCEAMLRGVARPPTSPGREFQRLCPAQKADPGPTKVAGSALGGQVVRKCGINSEYAGQSWQRIGGASASGGKE